MLNTMNINCESIPVEIFDENHKKIGEADSISRASKICKMRTSTGIWRYLFIKAVSKGSNRVKGVPSKMTGKRFHFKLKQI